MTFTEAQSWQDRGLQMQNIKDKCNAIIDKLSLPEDDARTQGMIHVRQMCNTLAHVPIALQHQAESNADLIREILLISDIEGLENVLRDLNANSKLSFITVIQFAFENCIKTILEALGEQAPKSFYESARKIIEITQIPDPDTKRIILMIPANMRNALHRNGIHTKPDIAPISIDGATYEFRQGQRPNCGSWSHLSHIIFEVLNIYEEILTASTITRISHIPNW